MLENYSCISFYTFFCAVTLQCISVALKKPVDDDDGASRSQKKPTQMPVQYNREE